MSEHVSLQSMIIDSDLMKQTLSNRLIEDFLLYIIKSSNISNTDFVILVQFVLSQENVNVEELSAWTNYSSDSLLKWKSGKELPPFNRRSKILAKTLKFAQVTLLKVSSQVLFDIGFEEERYGSLLLPETLIVDLIDFDKQTANILSQNGVLFAGQLLVTTQEQLQEFANLDSNAIDHIKEFLFARGCSFGMSSQILDEWRLLSFVEVSHLVLLSKRPESSAIQKKYGISIVEMIAGKAKGVRGRKALHSNELKCFVQRSNKSLFVNDDCELVCTLTTDMHIPQPLIDYCKEIRT